MVVPPSRVASVSVWLATFACAYLVFVTSIRLVTTAARWAAALIGASVAYVVVMLLLAAIWQHDSAHAAICCAGGMAVSVLCAALSASTILSPGHRAAGVWTCTILGMLYPLLLAASSEPGTPVRTMQLLYVAAAAVGGLSALRSLPMTRGAAIRGTSHA